LTNHIHTTVIGAKIYLLTALTGFLSLLISCKLKIISWQIKTIQNPHRHHPMKYLSDALCNIGLQNQRKMKY